MNRIVAILLALSLLLSLGISAAPAFAEAETRTIIDANGREVEIPAVINRAVVSNRYNLEIIRAIGGINQVVSIDKLAYRNSAFWPEFTEDSVYGNGTRDLDYEKILSYNPDVFIVLPGQFKDEIAEKLGAFGVPVVVLRCNSGQAVEAYNEQIRLAADIFGHPEGAQAVIDFCEEVRSDVSSRLADMPEEDRVKVYLEYYDAYTTCFGNEGAWGGMIYEAGGYNVIDASSQIDDGDYADAEAVITSDPDVIIRTVYRDNVDGVMNDNCLPPKPEDYAFVLNEMTTRESFCQMRAIQEGKIFMCSDFCLRGGGNVVGLAFFASWLHPERFEDYDAYSVFERWMSQFQNMEVEAGHVYEG